MKKILSVVAVSALLSTGAVAGEMYGSVGAAITTLSLFDSGLSIVGTAGMKLDNVLPNFAVELEASQTVADPSLLGVDLSIFGLGAYAVYNFNIPNTPVTIKPRLGLNHQKFSFDGYEDELDGGSDTSFSYGLGATYLLSDGLTVYANFTDKGDSNNIGAGVQMNF